MSFFDDIAAGATPSLEEFVTLLAPQFPLLERLAETGQDPAYHAEGDVFVHTGMVLDECYRILDAEARHFEANERLAFVLGALFHDIAKPITTRRQLFDDGERIVAPRHADRGRSRIAPNLLGLDLPHDVVAQVLAIVGHHHDPKRLVRKERPARSYRRLSRLAPLSLLYTFELADMRGRICDDRDAQLELLQFFRLYAEEAGVWETNDPYEGWAEVILEGTGGCDPATQSFILAQALRSVEAGVIATPHEEVARSYVYRDAYPELVLLCGPSGSGKSTWIAQHGNGARLVSLDDLREELTGRRSDQRRNGEVVQLAKERLREGLRAKERTIWDATSLNRELRGNIITLALDYHARVKLVTFLMPEDQLRQRNRDREHHVPEEVLTRQLERFDLPYADEAHEVCCIGVDGETIDIITPV